MLACKRTWKECGTCSGYQYELVCAFRSADLPGAGGPADANAQFDNDVSDEDIGDGEMPLGDEIATTFSKVHDHGQVAIKIIKNKPAYFHQGRRDQWVIIGLLFEATRQHTRSQPTYWELFR